VVILINIQHNSKTNVYELEINKNEEENDWHKLYSDLKNYIKQTFDIKEKFQIIESGNNRLIDDSDALESECECQSKIDIIIELQEQKNEEDEEKVVSNTPQEEDEENEYDEEPGYTDGKEAEDIITKNEEKQQNQEDIMLQKLKRNWI